MFKRALVTVSDKKGLYEFLKPFVDQGMEIVSTGGTAKFLKSKGLSVTLVEEQTQFPELMSGRVKTLHPFVHIPILARDWEPSDQKVLKDYQLKPFDLLVCNLYPFQEKKDIKEDKELVEWIDVGGPSLLRAAAKNFFTLTTVCSPEDYKHIQKKPSLEERKKLAGKVFRYLSQYDACIGETLEQSQSFLQTGEFVRSLRYGENPQQKAEWYASHSTGLHRAEQLQGVELSFNNLLDLEASVSTLGNFKDPCCVAVKHNNPCGVACGSDIYEAVSRSLQADPMSVFGGIVAINRKMDEKSAKELNQLFLEVVIAPDYSKESLEILNAKPRLRVLKWSHMKDYCYTERDLKQISGGFLLQNQDQVEQTWQESWQVLNEQPSQQVKEDLLFAWKVCAHLKSNAIVLVKDKQTLGLGMGQVNRISSVELALSRYQKFHSKKRDHLVLASDAFFPFPDFIDLLVQNKVQWVIQPGGSIKDKEIMEKAKAAGINMVITGQRHFRH